MKKYQLTLLSLCVAAFAQAKVTLPSFFTDNMVIQQNSRLTLPGKAKAGKQVTVKVAGIMKNIRPKRQPTVILR